MTVQMPRISVLEHLNKSNAVLLGLLAMLKPDKEVCVVRIVNLTYLLDEFGFQHDGVTLTGFDYIWDDDGPNAVNNEIARGLDALIQDGLVHYEKTPASSAYSTGGYRIDEQVKLTAIPLTAGDWALVDSVIREYGSLNRADLVKASGRTLPIKKGRRYGRLQFQPNPEIEAFKQSLREDTDFVEKCMAVLADGLEGVAIEELRSGRCRTD